MLSNTNPYLLAGYYMYFEASDRPPGTLAQLQSSTLPQLGRVDFWYFMYGFHMGTLNVYSDGPLGTKTVWTNGPGKFNSE